MLEEKVYRKAGCVQYFKILDGKVIDHRHFQILGDGLTYCDNDQMCPELRQEDYEKIISGELDGYEERESDRQIVKKLLDKIGLKTTF